MNRFNRLTHAIIHYSRGHSRRAAGLAWRGIVAAVIGWAMAGSAAAQQPAAPPYAGAPDATGAVGNWPAVPPGGSAPPAAPPMTAPSAPAGNFIGPAGIAPYGPAPPVYGTPTPGSVAAPAYAAPSYAVPNATAPSYGPPGGTYLPPAAPSTWPGLGPAADAPPNLPPLPGNPVPGHPDTFWDLGFKARGYYLDDQRIEWTGLEQTFGAEGVLSPSVHTQWGGWDMSVAGEFFINEPYDQNILTDTLERKSYLQDFIIPPFQINQLFLSVKYEDWTFWLGKKNTPFGRYYPELDTNAQLDAPFIRTEAILWQETGLFAQYHPGNFVGDIAVTNGGENLDTNSSKAIIARAGWDAENWAVGASIKWQDGIGSEGQKEYNNYAGIDFMYRWGIFTLSGELIYDQYGFTRPVPTDPTQLDLFFILNDLPRDLYYRDLNNGLNTPITGVGYYVNLGFRWEHWGGMLNYGEFYPEQIGVPQQDVTNRRGIAKVDYYFNPHLKTYDMVMLETEGYIAQNNAPHRGLVLLSGLEYSF